MRGTCPEFEAVGSWQPDFRTKPERAQKLLDALAELSRTLRPPADSRVVKQPSLGAPYWCARVEDQDRITHQIVGCERVEALVDRVVTKADALILVGAQRDDLGASAARRSS